MNEWWCDHCGRYFPALTDTDVCPCGAVVDAHLGYARWPDGHRWTPPGAAVCTQETLSNTWRVSDGD